MRGEGKRLMAGLAIGAMFGWVAIVSPVSAGETRTVVQNGSAAELLFLTVLFATAKRAPADQAVEPAALGAAGESPAPPQMACSAPSKAGCLPDHAP